MSEPTPTPAPSPTPTPEPAPAPITAQRPEWLGENHWDGEKGAINDDFGQHYTELAAFQKTETEKRAALAARKPEDVKFEATALPPELVEEAKKIGQEIKIDEKDPRIPILRELAIEHGWDQPVVNALVAMDAKLKIADRAAEIARVQAEDTKLGANKDDRKKAISSWADGLKTKGDITADEHAEFGHIAATAAGVTLIEKLIAKANGTVPVNNSGNPNLTPKPSDVPIEQRWYGPNSQKAS